MAITTPLLSAKAQIKEQGRQQRKTQQQRFVQNLGQSILGSALQLGTTLGVEHFKETRPSTIAKTDVWKQQSALTKKQVGAFDKRFAAEMKDLGLKAEASQLKNETSRALLLADLGVTMTEDGGEIYTGRKVATGPITIPEPSLGVTPGVDYAGLKAAGLDRMDQAPLALGGIQPRTDEWFEQMGQQMTRESNWIEGRVPVDSNEGRALLKQRADALRARKLTGLAPGTSAQISTPTALGTITEQAKGQKLSDKKAKAWQKTESGKLLEDLLKPYQNANQQGARGGAPLMPGEVAGWVPTLTGKLQKNFDNLVAAHAKVPGAPPLNELISLTPAQPGRESREGERQFIDYLEQGMGHMDMPEGWVSAQLPGLDFKTSEDRRAVSLAAGVAAGLFDVDPQSLQEIPVGGGADAVGVGTMRIVSTPESAQMAVVDRMQKAVFEDMPPGKGWKDLPHAEQQKRMGAGKAVMRKFISLIAHFRDTIKFKQQIPSDIQLLMERHMGPGGRLPPAAPGDIAPVGVPFAQPVIVPNP
jgi:hypothetical protein